MDTSNKNLPRDVFLYLLAIITLAISAVNFGTLLFQFINVYIKDVVADRYYSLSSYYSTIRWSLSSLIIVFPVLVWVSRFLEKDINLYPEKRELKIRKWLLYLTLFVAAGVAIGDLIALVYNFLQGELTLRFTLKIGTILLIAGSVFFYYLNQLRERSASFTRTFEKIIVGAVILAIIGGFITAGLPQSRRRSRLDEQRIQDLQSIQWQVIYYWQSKNKLPANLSTLNNDISGFRVPTDPQTSFPYEYRVTGNLSFQLCANFETDNSNEPNQGNKYLPSQPRPAYNSDVPDNWIHPASHSCFDRTIDPDMYPPINKPIK